MRQLVLAVVVAGLLAPAASAVAHEGHDHGKKVMGTVSAYHADMKHVEIKTPEGETVGVYLDPDTKFLHEGKAVDASHLTPGTRVVVDVKTVDGKMTATQFKLGGDTAAKAPTTAAPPHKH